MEGCPWNGDGDRGQDGTGINLVEWFGKTPVIIRRVFVKGQHEAGEGEDPTPLKLHEEFFILLHLVLLLVDG